MLVRLGVLNLSFCQVRGLLCISVVSEFGEELYLVFILVIFCVCLDLCAGYSDIFLEPLFWSVCRSAGCLGIVQVGNFSAVSLLVLLGFC